MNSKDWLFLSVYLIVIATSYILESVYHIMRSDPRHYWTMGLVIAISWLGALLCMWRSNMTGLLKRALITAPFALIFAIFMKIIGINTFGSVLLGLFIYNLLLIYKTPTGRT